HRSTHIDSLVARLEDNSRNDRLQVEPDTLLESNARRGARHSCDVSRLRDPIGDFDHAHVSLSRDINECSIGIRYHSLRLLVKMHEKLTGVTPCRQRTGGDQLVEISQFSAADLPGLHAE